MAIRISGVLLAVILLAGCTAAKIKNEADACLAPLSTEPQYALANAILSPEGGITPSMLANHSYPKPEHLAQFGPYLDRKTQCQRKVLASIGKTSMSRNPKYHVLQSKARLHWQNYATFLTGKMKYGDFYGTTERINSAVNNEFAQIERDQAMAETEAKAKQASACLASGGNWAGAWCQRPLPPIKPYESNTIRCTTYGNTTSCRK